MHSDSLILYSFQGSICVFHPWSTSMGRCRRQVLELSPQFGYAEPKDVTTSRSPHQVRLFLRWQDGLPAVSAPLQTKAGQALPCCPAGTAPRSWLSALVLHHRASLETRSCDWPGLTGGFARWPGVCSRQALVRGKGNPVIYHPTLLALPHAVARELTAGNLGESSWLSESSSSPFPEKAQRRQVTGCLDGLMALWR